MEMNRCPLCESPCIVKIVATEKDEWCEVDICKLCGTMYPRGRDVVKVEVKEYPKKKPAKKKSAPAKKKR